MTEGGVTRLLFVFLMVRLMKITIITNNTDVKTVQAIAESDNFQIDLVATTDVVDVLSRVRDAVHKGHKLLTHPLSGSVKPYETPYKSVAISSECGALDMASLETIENAIVVAKTFKQNNKAERQLTEKVLADFKLIDLQLISNALKSVE